MKRMTEAEIAHFAWWSKPGTMVRTEWEAKAAIRMCLTCQNLAQRLELGMFGWPPKAPRARKPSRAEVQEQRRLEHNRRAVSEWRQNLEREVRGAAEVGAGTEVRVRGVQG